MEQLQVGTPHLVKFKQEAYDLNAQLQKQQQQFCEKLELIQVQCKLGNTFTDELVDTITYYDETKRDLNELLKWKNSVEGKKFDFPKIDEMQKSIIFKGWKAKIRLVKKLINDARELSNSIVEYINDSLLESNLIPNRLEDSLLDV